VQSDDYCWVVARYVERNAPRAQLVGRAEEWRWSNLWRHSHGIRDMIGVGLLDATWPARLPAPLGDRSQRLLDDPNG
jgi:putative transposase